MSEEAIATRSTPSNAAAWRGDALDGGRLRTIDAGGVETRVYDAGDGPAVVFIHGGQFGSLYALDCWSLVLPLMASDFRVVAFDRLGQGWTANPSSPEGYRFGAVVDHAEAALDALCIDRAHVVGHSRGALVAAQLAIRRPTSTASLTLVDAGAVAPYDPNLPVGAFYATFERPELWLEPDRATVVAEPEAQALNPSWITEDYVARLVEIARLPKTRAARAGLDAVVDAFKNELEAARTTVLAELDERGFSAPTLVAWGYDDRSAPRHQAMRLFERVAAKTRDCRLLVLGGAGHYVFRDRPTEFASALSAFVLGVEQAQ